MNDSPAYGRKPVRGLYRPMDFQWTSRVDLTVKPLPTVRETGIQSLGQEELLEKEMAIHSSILAWKIPWTEEPGRLQSMGSQNQTPPSDFTLYP